jgi:hypothetical protein
METRTRGRHSFLECIGVSFITILVFCPVRTVHAQESKWNFNAGGGIGFPTGDLSQFINSGGNVVVGGGYNINKWLGTNGEFMWQDLPVNSSTKDALQTPGASARQYALTFDLRCTSLWDTI